jgi:anaerobic magnesium-protoporphyrin IX monomethyl ester cyclase
MAASRTIVLISPRAEPDWPDPKKIQGLPLALLTVARPLVAAGFDVEIVDQNVTPRIFDHLRTLAAPLWVGLSVIGGHTLTEALPIARRLRRTWPGSPIVWGGWNPTLMTALYEADSARPYVDVIVRGRGEAPALEISRRLAVGGTFEGIPGVSWRDADGRLRRNPDGAPDDYSGAEMLPYQLVRDPSLYVTRFGVLNYVSSYGCPHRCAFCGIPAATRTFRPIDNDRVVEQLRRLADERAIKTIVFLDDNFFTSKARVLDLSERLIAAGAPVAWHSNGRLDQVGALADSELALLARSGCRSINVGYETGSQEVADLVSKDVRVEDIFGLAERFARSGLGLSINFMVGLPGETPRALVDSLDTLRAIHARNPALEVCWYMFMPAPKTELWEKLVRDGRLREPATLEEHARFQSLDLEHPWYYPSPARSIFREWRAKHKAIAWYFHSAFAPPSTAKSAGFRTLADLRRRWCLWRWEKRFFRVRADWLAAYCLNRVAVAWRHRRARASRLGWVHAWRRKHARPTPESESSFLLVTGVQRST